MPVIKVPCERHQEVIDAYKSGQSMQDIGKKFNITYQNVNRILKEYDIWSEHGGAYKRKQQRIEQTRKMLAAGHTVSQIAKKMKVTSNLIYQYKRVIESEDIQK